MFDEIEKSPLVDVLSKQLGKQVVQSGAGYVYYPGLLPVEKSLVDLALAEQENDIFLKAKTIKISHIDSTTGNDIELLVGDNNKQKDKLALATALTRKESNGTATAEDIAQLDALAAMSLQVATLKVNGNAREAQVAALELSSFASLEAALLAAEAI